MATVYVSLSQAGARGVNGASQPVYAKPFRSETITSSGTTAAGALIAKQGDVATVVCATAVYANAGAAASATAGKYVPANVPIDIALSPGDTVHVIDAA